MHGDGKTTGYDNPDTVSSETGNANSSYVDPAIGAVPYVDPATGKEVPVPGVTGPTIDPLTPHEVLPGEGDPDYVDPETLLPGYVDPEVG